MDGRTYNAGAVGCLENIRHPCSVARIVMEHTDHVMLVGRGALDFAKKWGFAEENLLTEKARLAWLRWRENLSPSDHWGPPEHLRDRPELGAWLAENHPDEFVHGTVNLLAIDTEGNVAGITTTSGYASKIPGRVGDSPIIGAGLYVDNEVGAAGAVGRGEDVIKTCSSFYIVLRMAQGRSPQEACLDALEMIVNRYRQVNPEYFPGEHFVAINRDGETGCAAMHGGARMAVATAGGVNITTGPGLR
jgi:N4-(beta-N-acetylglucosaminyl)-L-asparaginase